MTNIDIAALVADREAGTKGPFQALNTEVVMADDVLATVAVVNFDNTEEAQALADVRRFARLDALETGYIEQAETIKRLTDDLVESRIYALALEEELRLRAALGERK